MANIGVLRNRDGLCDLSHTRLARVKRIMSALIDRENLGPWFAIALTLISSVALGTWVLSGKISDSHDQDMKLIAYYHDLDTKSMTDLHEKDMQAIAEMQGQYMQQNATLAARVATQESESAALKQTEERDYAQTTAFMSEVRSKLDTVLNSLSELQLGKSRSR